MSTQRLTCIICPKSCEIEVDFDEQHDLKDVRGYQCPRGKQYITSEVLDPVRILTALVRVEGGTIRMCPVRTRTAVPKIAIKELARVTCQLSVRAPIKAGDVIIHNMLGTNTDLIATRSVDWKP
jgi:CxxC motif-containing protein